MLDWKSPYEVLHKKKLTYDHLWVFGCFCFGANPSPSKDKFVARAIWSIFLGYTLNHKAYKLYDPHFRTIFISRDVMFHESIFLIQSMTIDFLAICPCSSEDFIDQPFIPSYDPNTSLPLQWPKYHTSSLLVRWSTGHSVKLIWLNDFFHSVISTTTVPLCPYLHTLIVQVLCLFI